MENPHLWKILDLSCNNSVILFYWNRFPMSVCLSLSLIVPMSLSLSHHCILATCTSTPASWQRGTQANWVIPLFFGGEGSDFLQITQINENLVSCRWTHTTYRMYKTNNNWYRTNEIVTSLKSRNDQSKKWFSPKVRRAEPNAPHPSITQTELTEPYVS